MIDPIKNRLFSWNTYSLVTLSLLTLAPLLVTRHFDPVHSFNQEWVAILLGLIAWLFALPLLWQQQTLFIPRLTLLPIALMAFITVQTQILPLVILQHAQMGILYLLWAALLIVLVKLLLVQTSREYVSLWIAIGLSAAALCSASIELFYRLNGVLGVWGALFQANNYGDLLALGLASVLYLWTIKPVWRVSLLIVAVLFVLGLSLTPSDLSNEQRHANATMLNNAGYHFWPSGFLAYQRAELQALNGANSDAQHTMTLALGAYPHLASQFIDELTMLNIADQQKTAFLRDMALLKTR
jgi:hypothetical protein